MIMEYLIAVIVALWIFDHNHIENNCTDDGCPSFHELNEMEIELEDSDFWTTG